MKLEGLLERVSALAEPLLENMGLELVDVEYKNEHGGWILRLYIDKPGGVTIDDCSDVSREFGTLLDVEDVMTGSYSLEVSSPGLDRPLVKERDFVKYAGSKAKIKTRKPVDGRKNFKATIESASDGVVSVVDFDGGKYNIEISNIDKARLIVEF